MILSKLLPKGGRLISPDAQGADFVELFFDLVFVYAITKITGITAHHLDGTHILQSLLIFFLVWLGWAQFTWTLNYANTRIAAIRLWVLIATGIAFIMATSVNVAFGDRGIWFALPYVFIRLIGFGIHLHITPKGNKQRKGLYIIGISSVLSHLTVLCGVLFGSDYQVWWWSAAIVIEIIGGVFGGQTEGWKLHGRHFAERYGLIVIIALGESLIVTASAINIEYITGETVVIGLLALILTCLLWWSYFAWIKEHLEEQLMKLSGSAQVILAKDVFSLMHIPLVFGIIGIAIGYEKMLEHTDKALTLPVAIALTGGYFLFLGFTAAAVYRSSKLLLLPRLIIIVVSSVSIYFTIGKPSYYALGILAFSLILVILTEWKKSRHS